MNINILKAKKLFSLIISCFLTVVRDILFSWNQLFSQCNHLVHCHRTTVLDHWIYDAFRIISYFIFRNITHDLGL